MTNVLSQTSPPKRIQPQNHVIATEQPPGNQTGKEQYRSSAAPRVVLPICKNSKTIQRLPLLEIHHSTSHDKNPTN